ncbi:ZINC FINGER PROTEIN [Salix purpurea]|uniref:ZINC FINGER PROTEIN n=1 Tax=Salix purpurea TaxID=77065 RepID=A0A9Q0WYL7_SALPP|nr:ZINC FINGER PROTEIN [Salix purpurea]
MAKTPISLLLLRRLTLTSLNPKPPPLSLPHFNNLNLKPYSTTTTAKPLTEQPKPSSLPGRMSFVFDQIDATERERAEKLQTLQKIRAWRQSKDTPREELQETVAAPNPEFDATERERAEKLQTLQKIRAWRQSKDTPREELQETVAAPNQEFDGAQKTAMIDSQNEKPESGLRDDGDSSVDFEESCLIELKRKKVELVHPWPEWIELMERAVQTACINFGKDRFDIFSFGKDQLDIMSLVGRFHIVVIIVADLVAEMKFLSKQDIQILVGYGCPNVNKKVVFSSKLLRKHVHLDEGDQKLVRTVVRKLLHEVAKLSAVAIDPNLPPPVIKGPPPKVKKPPPPRKRVGHDGIDMKKGDWLCPICDFMNFAKNVACLQCDAKRPKRQLIPGEWECPECNFLNYRRNMACLRCDCKRPPDALMETVMEERQHGSRTRSEKIVSHPKVSNACNFDFDDNESDGADVAAFEYADSAAMVEDSPLGVRAREGNSGQNTDDLSGPRRISREYSVTENDGFGRGFDDFDDEDDIERNELDTQNDKPAWKASRNNISDQVISDLEGDGDSDYNLGIQLRKAPSFKLSKPKHRREAFSGSDDELNIDSDEERSVHPKWKSDHIADARNKIRVGGPTGPSKGLSFGSDNEIELDSDGGDGFGSSHRIQGRKGSGRRNFERNSDWKDDSFSGSESDNSHRRSSRNKTGGNKLESGRRGNHFRGRDHDFVRDSEMRFEGKMGDRRKSWGDDSGRSSPGAHGKNRGFQGTDRSGGK